MNNRGIKDKKFNCLNCSDEFSFKGYSRTHKYCSLKCSSDHQLKKRKERDKNLFDIGELKNRNEIYFLLIERDGNSCSVCGITEHNGLPMRFWVDHIDGNAANNLPTNFRLICPNCDSQSETFGSKNRGNGRKSRGLPQYG